MKKLFEYLTVLSVGAQLIAAILQDDEETDRTAINAAYTMLKGANDLVDPKATLVAGLQRLLSLAKQK